MTLPVYVALLLALAGSACLSLGMVLQKKHVLWFETRRNKGPYARDMWFWMAGLLAMNLQPVFLFLSLFGLSPSVAAATNGASVTFTALFSIPLLGETMSRRKAAWSVLLFVAIAGAALTAAPQDAEAPQVAAAPQVAEAPGAAGFEPFPLVAALLVPLACAFLIARMMKTAPSAATGGGRTGVQIPGSRNGRLAVVMGAASGALGGFMVLPMRILQGSSLPVGAWFASPWIYLYAVAGGAAFYFSQKAYASGKLGAVAPAFYGLQVLWPALVSYPVFSALFMPAQAAFFVVIAVAVVGSASSGGDGS